MKFELHDKVAFKNYKKIDYASSIAGSIIAIKDNYCYFYPEKSEYGISLINTNKLKKIKCICNVCLKEKYVKVYCFYDGSCYTYYICKECLKKRPALKILFDKINEIDLSPRAIIDQTVVPEKNFWQSSLEQELFMKGKASKDMPK